MFHKQKFLNPRSHISTDRMQQQARKYCNIYLNFLRFLFTLLGQVKYLFLEVVSVRIRSRTEG